MTSLLAVPHFFKCITSSPFQSNELEREKKEVRDSTRGGERA
jgi:hypothetical protein